MTADALSAAGMFFLKSKKRTIFHKYNIFVFVNPNLRRSYMQKKRKSWRIIPLLIRTLTFLHIILPVLDSLETVSPFSQDSTFPLSRQFNPPLLIWVSAKIPSSFLFLVIRDQFNGGNEGVGGHRRREREEIVEEGEVPARRVPFSPCFPQGQRVYIGLLSIRVAN